MYINKQVDPVAMNMWRFICTSQSLLLFVIAAIIFSIGVYYSLNIYFCIPLGIEVLVFSGYYILLYPKRFYKSLKYTITDECIIIESGVFFISRVVIPIFRIQYSKTEQGPIAQRYGLSSLYIYTAGSTYQIPGLNKKYADELSSKILKIVRGSDFRAIL